MMQCEICGDTQGPFEVEEVRPDGSDSRHVRLKLVCEDCGKAIREERKHGTANLRNKGYARRVSRSSNRSKR